MIGVVGIVKLMTQPELAKTDVRFIRIAIEYDTLNHNAVKNID